jgi:hypothetical protein
MAKTLRNDPSLFYPSPNFRNAPLQEFQSGGFTVIAIARVSAIANPA